MIHIPKEVPVSNMASFQIEEIYKLWISPGNKKSTVILLEIGRAWQSLYIYIDSGGVVRTLIFTFMVKHTVFAG